MITKKLEYLGCELSIYALDRLFASYGLTACFHSVQKAKTNYKYVVNVTGTVESINNLLRLNGRWCESNKK